MTRNLICILALAFCLSAPVLAGESDGMLAPHAPAQSWSHKGGFGTYDRGAVQRGYQVYKQVCASCHSMNLVAYRNLTSIGFSEGQVKALAAEAQVKDGPNDQGDMFTRPGRPSDRLPAPFANDQAARAANGGALPPDLSLIIKAREGHEDYIYSLLTGYGKPMPTGMQMASGMNYNPYFNGGQIAMPAPLSENGVTYSDGTAASIDQQARDVVQFLAWASEPSLEERHQTGLKTLIFLAVFSILMYIVKEKVWDRLKK